MKTVDENERTLSVMDGTRDDGKGELKVRMILTDRRAYFVVSYPSMGAKRCEYVEAARIGKMGFEPGGGAILMEIAGEEWKFEIDAEEAEMRKMCKAFKESRKGAAPMPGGSILREPCPWASVLADGGRARQSESATAEPGRKGEITKNNSENYPQNVETGKDSGAAAGDAAGEEAGFPDPGTAKLGKPRAERLPEEAGQENGPGPEDDPGAHRETGTEGAQETAPETEKESDGGETGEAPEGKGQGPREKEPGGAWEGPREGALTLPLEAAEAAEASGKEPGFQPKRKKGLFAKRERK